jgi:formylglycine-generating enzyme
MRTFAMCVMLALLTAAVFADPADDAEARRRGVPLSLVQAEKALAAEKQKTSDLEKQLAALKSRLEQLPGGTIVRTATGPTAAAPEVLIAPKSLTLDLGGNVTLKLLKIPPGRFIMGSVPPQRHLRDELAHEVTISKAFYMGMTLVTVDQFAAFVRATGYKTEAEKEGSTDDEVFALGTRVGLKGSSHTWRILAFPQAGDHPVVNISWNDAQAFCDWLKTQSGKAVSLPTEAQWEFAARGDTTTEYIWGDDPNLGAGWANCAGQEVDELLPRQGIDYVYPCFSWRDGFVYTSPVGFFKPNGFGLYDMVGNASQWCLDEWTDYKPGDVTDPLIKADPNRKIKRGGSWLGWVEETRSAARSWDFRNAHNSADGMRIVVNY